MMIQYIISILYLAATEFHDFYVKKKASFLDIFGLWGNFGSHWPPKEND
jgi:hypothetical protein